MWPRVKFKYLHLFAHNHKSKSARAYFEIAEIIRAYLQHDFKIYLNAQDIFAIFTV